MKLSIRFSASCRWVEDSHVASRAIDILHYVQLYIEGLIKEKSAPKHTTFLIMQQGCKDLLLKLKLLFFVSVAKQFEAFLVRYQTDKPMIPHLCGDLAKLIKALMVRFIKESGRKVVPEAKLDLFTSSL